MIAVLEMKKRRESLIKQHPYAITQAKDGRWCTNIYTPDGKRRMIICASLEKLHDKLADHYQELAKIQTVTISDLCKEWLDNKLRYHEITPSSHTKYMTDYNRFIRNNSHAFCRISVSCITEKNLREYIKDTIVQFNLTRKSYKQLHILLVGTLRFAKEEGYTDFSAGAFFYDLILSDRMFARRERTAPELETFSDDEVSQLVHFLWEEQDLRGLGLILMFQTGMRVGELAALSWKNVRDGKIIITATEEAYTDPKTKKKICEVVDHAKTEAGERTIFLPKQAEKTIKAIRTLNPFGEYLFMDKLGRIRAKRFNTWLHRACRKIGIPERSTHKIRKTYASILLSGGVDEKLVTSQMGHTDITITRSIYYYNRDSEAKKRKVLSKAINF